jgi:hypothetical protein
MAALPNELSMVEPKPVHNYFAQADLLTADLEQPLQEKIRPQAAVKLPTDGQYQFSQAEPFHFEGIISYKGGYTQVAGHPSTKTLGFATLSTSVMEGLNVLDVVTADRVVAQISTVHPVYGEGQVPSVTFLGTRFENLRIDGHRVEIERDLDILGPKPADDQSYFDNRDVLARISQQYDIIADTPNLPAWASKEFPKGQPVLNGNGELSLSLVNGLKGSPGFSVGHIIDVPDFGRIYLGELKVTRTPGDPAKQTIDAYKFQLTMIRLQMGCLADGCACIVTGEANGRGGRN